MKFNQLISTSVIIAIDLSVMMGLSLLILSKEIALISAFKSSNMGKHMVGEMQALNVILTSFLIIM